MIMSSLVRCRYSLISVLGIRMHQNIAKGSGNVSITSSIVIGMLLHLLVPRGTVIMRYHMGSAIRVTSAHVGWVMSVGMPSEVSMMLWKVVCVSM